MVRPQVRRLVDAVDVAIGGHSFPGIVFIWRRERYDKAAARCRSA
jgi:hypothetical protein